ncbi:hypothetical protein HZB78_03520 [Candidatus Collierbacteria bacterium]|nr:hypothetical protein [Candidatus Collierbacteria bacterium]
MKNKLPQVKFMPAFLVFLVIVTLICANEIIKFNQFNNYLKQAVVLSAYGKSQEAQESLRLAKERINTTILVKIIKNWEIDRTEKQINEIGQLVDEKVRRVINEEMTTSSSTSTPTPAPIQQKLSTLIPDPTRPPEDKSSYGYDSYYPIILSFSDNKGGLIKYSQYNQYPYGSQNTGITLKTGDSITWKAEASDPKGRQISYNLNSNSQRFNDIYGRGEYKTTSQFDYAITEEDIKSAGDTLRMVLYIRSEKDNYRTGGGGNDDSTYLDYKLQPN